MSKFSGSRRLVAVVVAATGLALLAETAALGFALTKSGKAVTGVKAVVSYDLITTTSDTPVAMPDMSTTIRVPAGQQALLIITFAGETNCRPLTLVSGYCRLRVRVDQNYADPDVVAFDSTMDNLVTYQTDIYGDDSWETNSMQFVYGPVSAGTHTVTVLWWKEDDADDTIFRMGARTLTVLRSKV